MQRLRFAMFVLMGLLVVATVTTPASATVAINHWTDVTGPGLGIYTGSTGYGVKSSSGDGSDLDGADPPASSDVDEGLLFIFSNFFGQNAVDFNNPDVVLLTSIFFAGMGGNDDFNLDVDGVTVITDFPPNPTDDANMREVTVPIGLVGTEFRIWADGDSDDFRVAGISVQGGSTPVFFDFQVGGGGTAETMTYHTSNGSAFIVPQYLPEPTAACLLLLGAGAIGARRRPTRHGRAA